jgi:hypothetical protein
MVSILIITISVGDEVGETDTEYGPRMSIK